MRLHTLLPIGTSFQRALDRPIRYRPVRVGLPPDFSARSRGAAETLLGANGTNRVTSRTGELQAVIRARSAAPADGSSASRTSVRRRWQWAERLGRRVREAAFHLIRPVNRRRNERAIQTELQFSDVKVVRNDLMTADVEVVPANGQPPRRLSLACRLRLLGLWWAREAG